MPDHPPVKREVRWAVCDRWGYVAWMAWLRRDAIRKAVDDWGKPWRTLKRKYGMFVAKVQIGPVEADRG